MISLRNILSKREISIVLAAIFLAFFVIVPVVLANDTGAKKALEGLNQTAAEGYLGDSSQTGGLDAKVITNIPTTIGKVVGAGLAFIGIIFFVLMIYGGFTWMMAKGNEQEVAKAKNLIYSAVIGLIIVLAAYAITVYIGGQLTGT
jgi:cbb3-type cytochrome oxidase subunit 3